MLTSFANLLRSRLAEVLRSPEPTSPSPLESLISPDRDRRRNEESAPPADEQIDRPCIWGVEFFTPAYIDGLEAGLLRMGWGRSDTSTAHPDPIVWLRDLSRHRHSGASLPLGVLTTDESPAFLLSHRVPDLPQSAEHAQARISAITPSLFSVTVCFVIREDVVEKMNRVLWEQKASYVVSRDGRDSLLDPYSQKSMELGEAREALGGEVAAWFAQWLPGVFSSEPRRDIPTWEFVTSEAAHPLTLKAEKRPSFRSYLNLIGFRLGFDAWSHGRLQSLHLNSSESPSHPLLVGNSQALRAISKDGDELQRHDLVNAVDEALWEVLPAWAVVPLVNLYTQELLNEVVPARGSVEQALDNLREGMLRRIDLSAVASELRDICEGDHWLWDEPDEFVMTRPGASPADTTLGEHLRFVIGNQAGWLCEADRSVRDRVLQYGTLLASEESIRLQRRTTRLTWAVLGLALVTAVTQVFLAQCA